MANDPAANLHEVLDVAPASTGTAAAAAAAATTPPPASSSNDEVPELASAEASAAAGAPPTVRVSAATAARILQREALQAADPNDPATMFAATLPDHAVGSRCEVSPGGRRGVVRFVGHPGGVPRPVIAVELDEPLGSDVQQGGKWMDGLDYFEPSRPDAPIVWKPPFDVVCGDFPELDPFADLDDSEDEAKDAASK